MEIEKDTVEKSVAIIDYNKDIEIIKQTICKDLNDTELKLFMGICNRKQLDPLDRQIYAFKVGGKMQPLTSIDGFRLIAERTGKYAGQGDPLWCGPDGVWFDVWLQEKPPAAAKVTVYRNDCQMGFVGIARFSSFAGTTPIWKKMPDHMLAKVAESHALRKAFPQDCSGLYTQEEMDQVEPIVVQEASFQETPQYQPAPDYNRERARQNYQNITQGPQYQEYNNGQP